MNTGKNEQEPKSKFSVKTLLVGLALALTMSVTYNLGKMIFDADVNFLVDALEQFAYMAIGIVIFYFYVNGKK